MATVRAGQRPGEYIVTAAGVDQSVFAAPGLSAPEVLAIFDEAQDPPPPGPDALLADSVAAARRSLVALIDAVATGLTGDVPLAERLSWTVKAAVAREVVAGAPAPAGVAMLVAEAERTGETVAGLAARIVANADANEVAAAELAGIRRKVLARIATAVDPAAVAAAMAELEADLAAIATAAAGQRGD